MVKVSVSIHPDIEHKKIASEYAKHLKLWKKENVLSGYLGSNGQWEDNPRLCDSAVYKIHIKMPIEPQWNCKTPQAKRKSNHYLVYCRYWLDSPADQKYQIIAIMSPNGHELAKTSYLAVLEERAEQFQNNSY